MKNIFYLFISLIIFTGCYQYSEPTYPTLDGTYIIRDITVNSTNIVEGELLDSLYDYPMTFIYPNPIGALDTLKLNKSRIHISGNRLFAGYYLENGGDHWREEYPLSITQDFITRRWVNLNVSYHSTFRKYLIIEDGLEYLILECPKQYEDGAYGNEYSYSLTLYREGA